MSMKTMGKRGKAKGAFENPAKQAIVKFLREHGARTTAQIEEAFLDARIVTEAMLAMQPHWLIKLLHHLREAGHIDQETLPMRMPMWHVVPETKHEPLPASAPAASTPAGIAAPRQVNVMHGPGYQPSPYIPARAGALENTDIPSRMGSRRVPYRGAS